VIRAALAAAAISLVAASPASAADRKTLASYCSPSGDVCYGIVKRSRVVRFEITTAARYFARYTLCMRAPASLGKLRCGSFPMFRGRASTWYSSVRFRPTFPVGPRGVYRMSWRLGATPLGPTLRFRV
jgi:hypothetical protein